MSGALVATISAPVPISAAHNLAPFSCGKPPLDDWLRQRAVKSEGGTCRTYVVCSGNTVAAYYSLATGSIVRDDAPKKMRRNSPEQLPVLLLARLAVDTRYHGQGIGRGMLKEALLRALNVASNVGVRAVLVHAIDEDARTFYEKFGFVAFPQGTNTLFLPIESIARAIE